MGNLVARQADEVASAILRRRDLGCRASEVVRLEEGLNCEGGLAEDFWRLLGGRRHYRGERSTAGGAWRDSEGAMAGRKNRVFCLWNPAGAGADVEEEAYERGVAESNCVYRLQENRLVPEERAWASVPSVSLLGSSEVSRGSCCWLSVLYVGSHTRACTCVCVQVLLFDFGSEVYLWQGRDVPPSRSSVALQLAHQVWTGAYDYSSCRVNPLDPTRCNPSVPPYVHSEGTTGCSGCIYDPCRDVIPLCRTFLRPRLPQRRMIAAPTCLCCCWKTEF